MTGQRPELPPLPEEDHVCAQCGTSYPALSTDEACGIIAAISPRARAAALAVPEPLRRQRPRPGTWSVLEYACHLRDVYASSTIRLHRVRTEHSPVLEPMLNDLRARRFRYNSLGLDAVLSELDGTAEGFLDEVGRLSGADWSRTATRLAGEQRTALWLVRHAAHEGIHHLGDIKEIAGDAEPHPSVRYSFFVHRTVPRWRLVVAESGPVPERTTSDQWQHSRDRAEADTDPDVRAEVQRQGYCLFAISASFDELDCDLRPPRRG